MPIRNLKRGQQGITMLVVLLLLSVMLLGGLALARMTEVGALAGGNAAARETALQASEVGVNTAYMAVRSITAEDSNSGAWYSAQALAKDADGLPTVDWSTMPQITVGRMTVSYTVERACTTTPATAPLRQCLVRQVPDPTASRDASKEAIQPQNSRQFRITVRVTDQRGTQTFVQSLVTKG